MKAIKELVHLEIGAIKIETYLTQFLVKKMIKDIIASIKKLQALKSMKLQI